MKLLPIPVGELISGEFTPENPGYLRGEIDVELEPGTRFVLPCFAWVGERYLPELGLSNDPSIPDDLLLAGVWLEPGSVPRRGPCPQPEARLMSRARSGPCRAR